MNSIPFHSGPIASHDQFDDFDELNEPPLLEELGISFDHIWSKTINVILPNRISRNSMEDGDLSGPLIFACLFGFSLLLSGKVYFSFIYGFAIIGCLGMYTVLNLMSDVELDFHRTVSILGYCLLPIVLLSFVSVLIRLNGSIGFGLACFSIVWATVSATRFFENVFSMRQQRYLVAYPLFLLYSSFALLSVFGH